MSVLFRESDRARRRRIFPKEWKIIVYTSGGRDLWHMTGVPSNKYPYKTYLHPYHTNITPEGPFDISSMGLTTHSRKETGYRALVAWLLQSPIQL